MADDFFGNLKSSYIFSDEHNVTGLLKSTAVNGVADAAGRMLYNKFIGAKLNSFFGNFAGKYVNVVSSAVFALAGNLLAGKAVGSDFWSNFIQVAAAQPLGDYIAKALGDPMVGTTAAQQSIASTGGASQAELDIVKQYMAGSATNIAQSAAKGY